MDAPFDGDVADESVRSQGPSEESFPGFDKEMMPKDKVPMSSSERGCAASHIALWHHCSWLPDDGPPLLVLEDDLII